VADDAAQPAVGVPGHREAADGALTALVVARKLSIRVVPRLGSSAVRFHLLNLRGHEQRLRPEPKRPFVRATHPSTDGNPSSDHLVS
jgi:hypothetical protein